MKRESFLWSGAGALLAGCAGGPAAPSPAAGLPGARAQRPHDQPPPVYAYLGQLLLVPYDFIQAGWAACDGSLLRIQDFPALYGLLGTRFGGNGTTTFGIPDLRGREPLKGLTYAIALYGYHPSNDANVSHYVGEILLLPYDVVPKDFARCNGALLQIDQNQLLHSVLREHFGGDGLTTFGLPDLRGHEPATGLQYVISSSGVYPSDYQGGGGKIQILTDYVGQLMLFPYLQPAGWFACSGQLIPCSGYPGSILYTLLGTRFGGDNRKFEIPDLRGRAPIAFLNYAIAGDGIYPLRS